MGGCLELLDLLDDEFLVINAQRLMLLLVLKAADLGINLLVVRYTQVTIRAIELVSFLLLQAQRCLCRCLSSLAHGHFPNAEYKDES